MPPALGGFVSHRRGMDIKQELLRDYFGGREKALDLGRRFEPSSTALLTGFLVPGNCGWWREHGVRRRSPSSVPFLWNFSTFSLPTNNSNTKSRVVKTIVLFEASPNNSRFDGGLLLIYWRKGRRLPLNEIRKVVLFRSVCFLFVDLETKWHVTLLLNNRSQMVTRDFVQNDLGQKAMSPSYLIIEVRW